MIVHLLTDDNIYFAESYNTYKLFGADEKEYLKPENINIFKAYGVKNTIIGVHDSQREADLLRYEKLFTGTLTLEILKEQVIPKIKSIFEKFGRLDNDSKISDQIFIAQKNNCFLINSDFTGEKITLKHSKKGRLIDESLFYHQDKSPHYRLVKALMTEAEYDSTIPFPIAIIDTKSTKVKYVYNLEDL